MDFKKGFVLSGLLNISLIGLAFWLGRDLSKNQYKFEKIVNQNNVIAIKSSVFLMRGKLEQALELIKSLHDTKTLAYNDLIIGEFFEKNLDEREKELLIRPTNYEKKVFKFPKYLFKGNGEKKINSIRLNL